jgi:peptidoglycan/LPS O-acetylase OafA/YrhL
MLDMFWSMSGLWQVVGIAAVIILIAALLTRPGSVLAMVLAVGVVAAAVIVTWDQVETYRTQKAINAATIPAAQATAGMTVPPPNSPRSGS